MSPSSGSSSRFSPWPAARGSCSTWRCGRTRARPGGGSPPCSRSSSGGLLLSALGLSDRSVVGIALIAAGLALAWRQGGSFRPDAPLSYGGIALAAAGAVTLLSSDGATSALLSPGAVAGALLLVAGPWVWRLALDRDAERTARIRSDERSDVAARVHDSVLQTLALIQRHAEEPRRVASLARRQERELRGWLYSDQPIGDAERLARGGALGGCRRRRGASRRTRRDRERGRLPGRRSGRRRRAGGTRGDDERGQVRGRRGDRRLRRGHRRGDLGLRARPRRRVRPRRRAGRPSRAWWSRSRAGCRAQAGGRPSSRARAKAPRSSCT